MSKEIVLDDKKFKIDKAADGDVHKVIMKADFYDKDEDIDVLVNVRLIFKRRIPPSWMDIISEDYADTIRMVLSAKSQQTRLVE